MHSRASKSAQKASSGKPLHIAVVVVEVAVVVVAVDVVEVAVTVVLVPVVVVAVVAVVDVSVADVTDVVVDVAVTVVSVAVVVVEDVTTHERQRTGQLAISTGPMMLFSHCFRVWWSHICGSSSPLHVVRSASTLLSSLVSEMPDPSANKSSSPLPEPCTVAQVLQSAGQVARKVAPNKSDWHCTLSKVKHASSSTTPPQFSCVVVVWEVVDVKVTDVIVVELVVVVGVVVGVDVAVDTCKILR